LMAIKITGTSPASSLFQKPALLGIWSAFTYRRAIFCE
jgi:hypothetical protein